MVKQWVVFTAKERITGMTRVKLIQLLSQERQKSKETTLFALNKSSTERLQSKQAMFSLP